MIGLEFVADQHTKAPFEEAVLIGSRVASYAQQKGLIVRPLGHMIVLSPPLILTVAEVEFVAGVLRESIEQVLIDLKQEKLL